MYDIKNLSDSIVDIDTKSGTVVAYAAHFGNKDADGDITMPGAFTKSLAQNSQRVLHLYQHDSYRPLSSVRGGNLKVYEDAKGLKYESVISPTSWGKDVVQLISDGVLSENSFGFTVVKSEDVKGYRALTELKLWEVSSVSYGSNPEALNVKSLKDLYTPDYLEARIGTVTKSLGNKNLTDDSLAQLEIYLLQLNRLLIDSKSIAPLVPARVQPDVDEYLSQRVKAWQKLINSAPAAPVMDKWKTDQIRFMKAKQGRLMANLR